MIDSPADIAQAFNKYFIQSVNEPAAPLQNTVFGISNIKVIEHIMYLNYISEPEVVYVIMQLNSSSSSGLNSINNNINKNNIDFLVQPLTTVIDSLFIDLSLKKVLYLKFWKKLCVRN